jgi:hypothetical protein
MNNYANTILPCFIGAGFPELITGKGIILSDIRIERGRKYQGMSLKKWKKYQLSKRRSGKHRSGLPSWKM